MGNCQAIDNASLQVQHPSGRVDQMYSSVTASEIMKMHPGHYVALLLTTTLCHPSTTTPTTPPTPIPTPSTTKTKNTHDPKSSKNNIPLRITRIKLLKPTDLLVLGHVYRLITTQEVMKGLWAKKCAKMKQQQSDSTDQKQERLTAKEISELEAAIKKYELENITQAKHEKQRSRISPPSNSAAAKSRNWHPSLRSISEAIGN